MEKITVSSIFFARMHQEENLWHDEKYISDGNIAILKEHSGILASLCETSKSFVRGDVEDRINKKGELFTEIVPDNEVADCIYNFRLKSTCIALSKEKNWYLDNRWYEAFDNQFQVETLKLYPYNDGVEGCICEVTGWADEVDFQCNDEPHTLGYIMGIYKEKIDNDFLTKLKELQVQV